MKQILGLIIAIFVFATNPSGIVAAHGFYQDISIHAKVISILSDERKEIPELNIERRIQQIEARILEGPQKGRVITVENYFIPLEQGSKFFLTYFVDADGVEGWIVQEPDRRGALVFFVALFVLAVWFFAGLRGLRSLFALLGSFLILFYFLFPQLLAGASPILASAIFAVGVLTFAIYVTHGYSRKSAAAWLGAIATISITIFFADFAVKASKLSGFVEEATLYLQLDTGGLIDFRGLLLGAIIIGVLGVLDDIAMTQVATVQELHHAAPHLTRKEVYKKALNVGRAHVSALVNTLALAYAGSALPLLLWFYHIEFMDFSLRAINREVFATEIIRTIVGSTAIILAVPITTFIATYLLIRPNPKEKEHA
jgi:uncharacterized membrane protein